MKFTLEIESGNAAMVEDPAGATYAALERVADRIANGETEGKILDVNGNTVGQWSLEAEES